MHTHTILCSPQHQLLRPRQHVKNPKSYQRDYVSTGEFVVHCYCQSDLAALLSPIRAFVKIVLPRSRLSTFILHHRINCRITNQSPKHFKVVTEILSVCMKECVHDSSMAFLCCPAQSGPSSFVLDVSVGSVGEKDVGGLYTATRCCQN